MKLTPIVVVAVLVFLGGGLAFAASMGRVTMKAEEMAGLAVAIAVIAGSVAFALHTSADTVRHTTQQAELLAAGFTVIAKRTGLRVQQPEPIDHPVVGKIGVPPALIGLYRGWWVRVQLNVAGDELGQFEILVSAGKGVKWPKLGSLSASGSPDMSPSARAALERLKARRKAPDRVWSVRVSPATLRAVTYDMVTGAPDGTLSGASALEGILDDLVVLAEGLPRERVDADAVPAAVAPTAAAPDRPLATRVVVLRENGALGTDLLDRLAARGSSVKVLSTDEGGLRNAVAEKPDLILLSADPLAGLSICNRIKRTVTLRDVPTILISAAPAEALFREHRKLATHADDYIEGPIESSELFEHIERLVRLGPPVARDTDAR